MTKIIDARGYSCPQPVMMTQQAIKAGEFPIEILVETVTSRENVRRAAERAGLLVEIEGQGEEFKLVLRKP